MFPSRSQQTPARPPLDTHATLTEAAARTARHLGMCRELAELGMDMARTTAAAFATAQMAAQMAAQMNDEADAERAAAQARNQARNQAQTTPPESASQPPSRPAPDHIPGYARDYPLAFSRLASAVRQAIALEAKLSAPASEAAAPGAAPRHHTRPIPAPPPPDPRRAPIKRILAHALASHPDQAHLKRDTADHLEQILVEDAGHTLPTATILDAICEEADLEIDFGQLPDDLLDAIIDHADADPP